MIRENELEFTHLILTKFNLDYTDILNEEEEGKKIWLDSKWLDSRFELFEKYCFPSVQSQTVQNFFWLVFFHKDTPQVYKDKIESYQKKMANFRPIYTEKRTDIIDYIKKNIQTKKWLISTRLDNDDGFAVDYIENIQKYFVKQHMTFLDFQLGYSYQASTGKVRKLRFRSNAFLSLIENTEISKTTAYSYNHTLSMDFGELRSFKTKPMWIQVAHEDNRLNYFNGRRVFFFQRGDFEKRFVILDE